MRGIKVINNTKNITLEFLPTDVYQERFSEFSFWASVDIYTRKCIAEKYGVFILYGWGGFGKSPKFNDIRNTTINTHGSTRVSGFAEELELNLVTEPYLYCNNYEKENLYNLLLNCFINEFDAITIEFDLGCRKVYQYYSFQEQEDGLASFKFKGAKGGNYYYSSEPEVITFPLDGVIAFEVPVEIGPVTSVNKKLYNVVGVPKGTETLYNFNLLLETSYLLEIRPIETKTDDYVFKTKITINGVTVFFDGEHKVIKKVYDGTFYDENDQEIKAEGDKKLPLLLDPGVSTTKIETEYTKGDYECQITIQTAASYI